MNATMPSTVLIAGATSDIARAIARVYARAGRPLVLAARDPGRLHADAEDLRLRYDARVEVTALDVLDTSRHVAFVDGLAELPDTVVMVAGLLGDQAVSERDAAAAELVMRTNYIGPAVLLDEIANRMAARGAGTIIGISSVAGDRGRASNYVYGSAKAGFTAFLSGLRNRLASANVRVITVKPGFVATRMTAEMRLPPALTAEPEEVARHIIRADQKRRDVVYVRPVWRWIMLCISLLPEPIFKRTRL
jgi:decaprenylphospho-beta-D-erythro-pentofuranosid-2-ulose 2-reductase